MIKFIDKRTDTEKEAFEIIEKDDRTFVRFYEDGKVYGFAKSNIEILEQTHDTFWVYAFEQPCYKCGKTTRVYTYMLFDGDADEELVFPWDRDRLNREKSSEGILSHMEHPEIEFYSIKIIGDDRKLDQKLMLAYPEDIHVEYSATQKRKYAMNLCKHCRAKQGQFFIYERINRMVQKMQDIEVVNSLER